MQPSAAFANETNNITSKVYEFKDKDGRLVGSYEDFFRGKDKIMMTTSSINSQGKLVVRSRSYFLHGDMMTTELAVRKDDKLDTILVYHPGTEDLGSLQAQQRWLSASCEHGIIAGDCQGTRGDYEIRAGRLYKSQDSSGV